ncbi:MAG: hypothetical protein RLZZ546_770 [Bacteroidota bacterium]|jgi:hypothetical protein
MRISKFLKVDNDVLLEWIYDDDNFLIEDYRIIIDTLSNTRAFSNTEQTNSQNSETKNISKNQLFLLDFQTRKWGIVDPNTDTNKYLFLQYKNFSGNVPFRYDIIRLHFPVNYTFKDKLGFLLNINLMNESQTIDFPISNYFYDKTDPNRLDMDLSSPPFLFNEKLWGKYIEIAVPSPYALVNDISINQGVRIPRTGTIHKNLVDENFNVLSTETPIFIDFQFLTKKNNVLNQISYYTTEPFSATIPVVPEFENLGVQIQKSAQGDYFEIFGTFNNTISEFNTFIENGILMGKRYYAIYEITTFEKNIQSGSLTISQFDNFELPVEFRPIIKYSTTTAVIDVTMKIINAVDDSTITRMATYAMLQDEVAKYSRFLTKIDVRDTFKPKVYNAKPDQLNITIGNGLNSTQVTKVPYAVMYERINVSVKNVSEQVNDTTYYGQGQQQVLLYPSNNVYKFAIIGSVDSKGINAYAIPTESQVFLRFKSTDTLIETPLFYDSNEVDLKNGIVVFNILESSYDTLKKMYTTGFDQFYIVLKSDVGVVTTLYSGRYLPYNSF